MEDQLDLKLREDPLERTSIENRAGDLAIDLPGNRGIQWREVQCDDRTLGLLGKAIDQSVPDLAIGAGDEHDRFAHAQNYTEPSCIALCRRMREPAASQTVGAAVLSLLWLSGSRPRAAQPSGGGFDFSATMRVDYFHAGGPKTGETFALDRVVNDGPWAGSRTQLVDDTNLGKYLFEVRARPSAAVLYSRGFASIYGEWETTPEVKTAQRTFHESMRMPWPSAPVTITLKKRQRDNSFREVWSVDVDPSSRFVNRARLAPRPGSVWPVMENGPIAQKVDLLIIGEGYTRAQLPKFHADVTRLHSNALRAGAVQEPEERFQCPRAGPAFRSERNQPAERQRLSTDADLGRVQRVRLGTLRADARQSRAARCGLGCAVRVPRDPRERQDLWRRRDLQRSGDRLG